ncbi:hypothetical protein RHCRD62_20708 [Rhodococcus sp. RD6.2]|nr:hypothetical protein RHCRD62_20708 [Rhodococcus sp. RD6.2]
MTALLFLTGTVSTVHPGVEITAKHNARRFRPFHGREISLR